MATKSGRVEADAPRERIKVLDFGIAKLQMPQPGDSVKTRTGTLMGTPVYMSPEQCRGTKLVDHRSDVYSLGIIFYEMLIGEPPFTSEGFGELVNMHLNVLPPSPRAGRPEVSEPLDAVVLKMLAKSPDDRYPDMGSLTGALRLAAGPPFSVHRSSPDLNDAPTQLGTPAPLPVAPLPARVTTFRTGTGEVGGPTVPSGRTRGKLFAVGAAVVALGAGAFFFRAGPRPAPPPEAVAAAPAPPPAPAVKPAPAPAVKPHVTVRLASDPEGARVFDVVGGGSLGTTPLTLSPPRGAALQVRLEKDGYLSATREIPLAEDQSLEVALEHKPAPKPKASRRPTAPRDDGPAKL